MTDRELTELLSRNPDLSVGGGEIGRNDYAPISPFRPQVKISEHELQTAIVEACDRRSILRVEYGLLFAVPNGQYRQGQRMEPGLRPGVPDLFLPVARKGFHGMFIELKCGYNKPSQVQLDWIRKLKAEGYRVVTVWDSVEVAMLEIESYLEG